MIEQDIQPKELGQAEVFHLLSTTLHALHYCITAFLKE
jgi:hypothetical protein